MEKIQSEIKKLETENKKMRTANKRMQKTINEKTKAINENGILIDKNNKKIERLVRLIEKKKGRWENGFFRWSKRAVWKFKKIKRRVKRWCDWKYPELRKDEIKYLTQLLGMELEILFPSKFAADDSRNNIYWNFFKSM